MTFNLFKFGAIALSMFAAGTSGPIFAQAPAENPLHLAPASTVTIVVADVNKEIDWWQNVLGFRELKRAQGPTNAVRNDGMRRVELGGYRVDLVWHKGSTRPAAPPPEHYYEGYSHISFTVDSTIIEANYKWLMAHGVKIDAVRDKTTNALRIMRFNDPEGNEIHIEIPN
jgi:catechol 2,3-dioxygenase-like lactoylglutathione lyase family enzyme